MYFLPTCLLTKEKQHKSSWRLDTSQKKKIFHIILVITERRSEVIVPLTDLLLRLALFYLLSENYDMDKELSYFYFGLEIVQWAFQQIVIIMFTAGTNKIMHCSKSSLKQHFVKNHSIKY